MCGAQGVPCPPPRPPHGSQPQTIGAFECSEHGAAARPHHEAPEPLREPPKEIIAPHMSGLGPPASQWEGDGDTGGEPGPGSSTGVPAGTGRGRAVLWVLCCLGRGERCAGRHTDALNSSCWWGGGGSGQELTQKAQT